MNLEINTLDVIGKMKYRRMKLEPSKLLLNWLLVSSATLFAVNTYVDAGITITGEQIRFLSTIFFVLTLVVVIVHLATKSNLTLRLTILTATIFLLLNLALSVEVAAMEYHSYQLSQIAKINTCEKAKQAFEKDIRTDNVRYFMFGIGIDKFSDEHLENFYDLNVYNMGCIVDNSLECYNELVEDHISKQLQVEFWAFLEQREKAHNGGYE